MWFDGSGLTGFSTELYATGPCDFFSILEFQLRTKQAFWMKSKMSPSNQAQSPVDCNPALTDCNDLADWEPTQTIWKQMVRQLDRLPTDNKFTACTQGALLQYLWTIFLFLPLFICCLVFWKICFDICSNLLGSQHTKNKADIDNQTQQWSPLSHFRPPPDFCHLLIKICQTL